jgi:ribosome-binding protein aMBF1 (putative translation factor)
MTLDARRESSLPEADHGNYYSVIIIFMARETMSPNQRRRGRRLGQLVKEAREGSARSQERLAKAARVSTSEVRRLEGGLIANPGFFTVAALARELELELDDLADLDKGKRKEKG